MSLLRVNWRCELASWSVTTTNPRELDSPLEHVYDCPFGQLYEPTIIAVRNTRWKIKCDKTLVMCAAGACVFAVGHGLW